MTQGYRQPRDVADRFWEKVDQSGSCWVWTGSSSPRGYGTFGMGSRTEGTRTTAAAHRVAYWLEHGIWSSRERQLHHRCENPSCVRPSHLELLSPREHVYQHDGPTAQNGRLTHCRKCGMELAGGNLIVLGRRCRSCRNAYMREIKRAKRRTLAKSKGGKT